MDADFWLARWQNAEIGFHLPQPHPKLRQYWSAVAQDSTAPVLVPLCGKSLDMGWLSAQGHDVCGVELSDQALDEFVAEAALGLEKKAHGYIGPGWQLVCGDWFEFSPDQPFSLFYDRAALIALPPAMRGRYVGHLLTQLAPGACGLLITLEYPQSQMDGPPFSVPAQEVRELFDVQSGRTHLTELHRADILQHEARFRDRGLTELQEVVYRIDVARS